jgi:hypothetical protein
VKAFEAVLAKRLLHRGLDAQEHAERSMRTRIAADVAGRIGKAGNELG